MMWQGGRSRVEQREREKKGRERESEDDDSQKHLDVTSADHLGWWTDGKYEETPIWRIFLANFKNSTPFRFSHFIKY